jgi:hypothetical protein
MVQMLLGHALSDRGYSSLCLSIVEKLILYFEISIMMKTLKLEDVLMNQWRRLLVLVT